MIRCGFKTGGPSAGNMRVKDIVKVGNFFFRLYSNWSKWLNWIVSFKMCRSDSSYSLHSVNSRMSTGVGLPVSHSLHPMTVIEGTPRVSNILHPTSSASVGGLKSLVPSTAALNLPTFPALPLHPFPRLDASLLATAPTVTLHLLIHIHHILSKYLIWTLKSDRVLKWIATQ